MSDELAEVAQILRVEYEGMELMMRVGAGGIKACVRIAEFIYGMLDFEKRSGKTSMRKMLQKDSNLQVVKIDESQVREAEKLFKKYGVLFSRIPDGDRTDHFKEYIVPTVSVPQVNSVLERLGKGSISSVEKYLDTEDNKKLDSIMEQLGIKKSAGDVKDNNDQVITETESYKDIPIEKQVDFISKNKTFDKQMAAKHFGISDTIVDDVLSSMVTLGALKIREDGTYETVMDKDEIMEKLKSIQEKSEQIKLNARLQDESVDKLEIAKDLLTEDDRGYFKIRVNEKDDYIFVGKDRVIKSGGGMMTLLDKDNEYMIYDKNDKMIKPAKYDEVASSLNQIMKTARDSALKEKLLKERGVSVKGKTR